MDRGFPKIRKVTIVKLESNSEVYGRVPTFSGCRGHKVYL